MKNQNEQLHAKYWPHKHQTVRDVKSFFHGALKCSPAAASTDSSAASAAFTLGCERGSSRYQRKKRTAQTTPGRPNSRNAVRQVTCCRQRYTSIGVKAPPSRALIHMMPCARGRSSGGSQRLNALVRFGNAPASPAPKRNCEIGRAHG